MSSKRKMRRHLERETTLNDPKEVKELSPAAKLEVRDVLVRGLRDAGMVVLETELTGGHVAYVVLPGEHEVHNDHEKAVWEEIALALESAAKHARMIKDTPVEQLRAMRNQVKGGSA